MAREKNSQANEYFVSVLTKKYEDELRAKDKEIKELKDQLEVFKFTQKHLAQKKSSISNALIAAVDKAKEIEDSSKKVYELKVAQINALYSRYEKLLDEMLQKHPDLVETEGVRNMVSSFKESITEAISEDLGVEKSLNKQTSGDQIRVLLNRVNSPKSQLSKLDRPVKIERKKTQTSLKNVKESGEEKQNAVEKQTRIKPISSITMSNDDKYETLADKFLNSNDDESSDALGRAIYSKKSAVDPYAFPEVNESGFNLEEAINPTEGLEQIMKSFDFYED